MCPPGGLLITALIDVDPAVVEVEAGPLEVVVGHDLGPLLGAGGAGVGLVDDAIISPAPGVVFTHLITSSHHHH